MSPEWIVKRGWAVPFGYLLCAWKASTWHLSLFLILVYMYIPAEGNRLTDVTGYLADSQLCIHEVWSQLSPSCDQVPLNTSVNGMIGSRLQTQLRYVYKHVMDSRLVRALCLCLAVCFQIEFDWMPLSLFYEHILDYHTPLYKISWEGGGCAHLKLFFQDLWFCPDDVCSTYTAKPCFMSVLLVLLCVIYIYMLSPSICLHIHVYLYL